MESAPAQSRRTATEFQFRRCSMVASAYSGVLIRETTKQREATSYFCPVVEAGGNTEDRAEERPSAARRWWRIRLCRNSYFFYYY